DLQAAVDAGTLPPLAERLPDNPRVIDLAALGRSEGKYGGELRILMGSSKDIRMMTIYGYARLVVFNEKLELVPDILESFDVEEGRIFTLHLRPGHKWSDGHPFTSEDFRYFWEDVETNEELSRGGVSQVMLVDGQPPKFEVIDETTVRYTWDKPNPQFLPSLAGGSPNYIYLPAHYLKQYHTRYTDAATIEKQVQEHSSRNWVALHTVLARQYRPENPDLPTLQPWWNRTAPPAERFVFERNPYFHRVDASGRQLPYIGRVLMGISSAEIIAAKTGTGEADLQARYLRFDNYPFLKSATDTHPIKVALWQEGTGSQVALLPNLNVADEAWRTVLHDVRFRRALSLAVDRHEINQVIYYGLGVEGNHGVLPGTPLYDAEVRNAWSQFDPDLANKLLDDMGLTQRNDDGIRLLPDGRPMEIVVESAGENSEEADVLELINDTWLDIGIKLHTKPSERTVLRNRIFAGETLMAIWFGYENGLPTADMSPEEFVPVHQQSYQWPKWGQYYETAGKAGELPTLEPVLELARLNSEWLASRDSTERERI
ncbi:MAG: ABC transporter substrate-binding protein, partial [Gammaproteobacteria bacterium]|nr:ABC transporter substrate-binding protein [Gammaproteobacteria bacterium]